MDFQNEYFNKRKRNIFVPLQNLLPTLHMVPRLENNFNLLTLLTVHI